jgi:anti-sigma regulatory factor (Ser/Thr protein kinase)
MDGSPQIISIELPASTHYLVLVRQVISSLAHQVGFMSADVAKIELALDEACSNSIRAIREAEGDCPVTRVQLDIAIDKNSLTVTIRDNGTDFSDHFNRETPMEDLIGSMRTSGYGLRIIKTCMDEVVYEHQPGCGNFLRLVKYVASTYQGRR